MMKKIVILGSTGSIGRQTLEVVEHHPDRFCVLGLVAGSNRTLLEEQARKFKPEFTALNDLSAAVEMAVHPNTDIVVSAIVGTAGLRPTFAALKAGKRVALANKESLVAAGPVMTRAWREGGGELIPVDSEHSAIHQLLAGASNACRKIILTASGGPFRTKTQEELQQVTVQEALKHPNWKMGNKITIDSATLMNKGLERIEARWLFDLPPEKIDVVIHPQSIVHSLVEFEDRSVLAQLSLPDMRIPIAYALAWPERIAAPARPLNLAQIGSLDFEKPDEGRFPSLKLAREALEKGGSYPCVLNAANEAAVGAFLEEKITFLDIARRVEKVLERHQGVPLNTLEDVLEIDRWARENTQC